MSRILCVEDSPEFQSLFGMVFREHSVTQAETISDAMKLLSTSECKFDIILLDISLPDGNGMRILPQLRNSTTYKNTPIIVVSGDADTLTKVAAFGVGADDYITKPLDVSELKARIEARLRATQVQLSEKLKLEFLDIVVDKERMTVEVVSQNSEKLRIDLTPIEFRILCLLINRPEMVFSRELIIERIWGVGRHITTRTVDAHISHLRAKLEVSQVQIETVLSFGYKLSSVIRGRN